MQEVCTLLNDEKSYNDEEIISYIKKLFTIIQIVLDMNITFYYSCYLVLKERYRNLELNDNKLLKYQNINRKDYKENDRFK